MAQDQGRAPFDGGGQAEEKGGDLGPPENDAQVTESLLIQTIDEGDFKRLKQWLDDGSVKLVLPQSKDKLLVLLNAVAREQFDAKTVSELQRVDNVTSKLLTVLQLVAFSGDDRGFTALLDACQPLGKKKTILTSASNKNEVTILMAAAESGSIETFRAALAALKAVLGEDDEKMKDELVKRSSDQRSLLRFAADGGKKEVLVEVVRACGTHKVPREQILRMKDFSVPAPREWMRMADTDDQDVSGQSRFDAFSRELSALNDEEKRRCFESRNILDDSLLSKAVESRNFEEFKLVLDFAWDSLCRDQLYSQLRELIALEDIVGNTLLSSVTNNNEDFSKFGERLLSKAYRSGDLGLFEAAARCVAAAVPSDRSAGPSGSTSVRSDSTSELRHSQLHPFALQPSPAGAAVAYRRSQVLEAAAERIEVKSPWFEMLGLQQTQTDGSGDVAEDANKVMLKPVLAALEKLRDEAQGAGNETTGLVQYCVGIYRSLLEAANAGDIPYSVEIILRDITEAMEAVGTFVKTYGSQSGGCSRLTMVFSSRERDAAAELKEKLKGLMDTVLASRTLQDHEGVKKRRMIAKRAEGEKVLRKALETADEKGDDPVEWQDVFQLFEDVLEKDMTRLEKDRSLLGSALRHDNRWLFKRCRRLDHKVAQERNSKMDNTFAACARIHLDRESRRTDLSKDELADFVQADLVALSSLIASSARPSADILKEISRRHDPGDLFKNCCLRAVTSAANPFIPGLTLSIRLGQAAKQATEGEKRTISVLQSSVEELLLEIFERLPRTVRGFDDLGGVDACAVMFERGMKQEKSDWADLGGPLDMILSSQQQLQAFCKVPLVMDYLSSKFMLGLPDLSDTEGILRNAGQLERLSCGTMGGRDTGFILGDGGEALSAVSWFRSSRDAGLTSSPTIFAMLKHPLTLLQAAHAGVPNLVYFPGAQFVVAGVVAEPSNYYRVPALRVALDFVVYLGMVAILSYFVLFHKTSRERPGDTTHDFRGEEGTCAIIFIAGGVYREALEMKRDIRRYFKDKWNVLDALGLLFLFIGLVIRLEVSTSQWGLGFYALSAPLVISRVLFFAQILPFQGPMIEVIFRMTATLVQFGFVMLVIMIGFAMALHALFLDDHDDILGETFGEAMLGLFRAMLGDTAFFDEFNGKRHDEVATMLVIAYLLIMTIMLLNLLVAILSTAHAQVHDNVRGEFRVSKARVIEYYRTVVREDVLPAPFNLLQPVASTTISLPRYLCEWCRQRRTSKRASDPAATASAPPQETVGGSRVQGGRSAWGNTYSSARDAFGQMVFTLVLGSVAVVVGALLWIGSALFPYAQYTWFSRYRETKARSADSGDLSPWSVVLRLILVSAWCIVGAPLSLFLVWLWASCRVLLGFWLFPCLHKMDHQDKTNGGEQGSTGEVTRSTVESMLKNGPSGVGADQLRIFLDDPMNDKDVRQDEKDRGTTVEHIKLLRNRLEKTRKGDLEDLRDKVASKAELGRLRIQVGAIESKLDRVLLQRGEKGVRRAVSEPVAPARSCDGEKRASDGPSVNPLHPFEVSHLDVREGGCFSCLEQPDDTFGTEG